LGKSSTFSFHGPASAGLFHEPTLWPAGDQRPDRNPDNGPAHDWLRTNDLPLASSQSQPEEAFRWLTVPATIIEPIVKGGGPAQLSIFPKAGALPHRRQVIAGGAQQMADQLRDCFGIADPDVEDQSIGACTNQQLPLTDGTRASPWRTITGIEAVIIAASTMPNNTSRLYVSIRSRVLLADWGYWSSIV